MGRQEITRKSFLEDFPDLRRMTLELNLVTGGYPLGITIRSHASTRGHMRSPTPEKKRVTIMDHPP